jgi:hypothetical protein
MKQFILLFIGFAMMSCEPDDIDQVQTNPCDGTGQGFSLTNSSDNFEVDDQSLTVHYVTGHPQGNYYHVFNNTGTTITNFYTFAVNTGDVSTFDQTWNTTAGSFLSVDNTPIYSSNSNPITITTIEGGSQVGDRILIEITATNNTYIEGQYCVDIDEVISVSEQNVYITDGTDFKIINVSDPLLPFTETSTPASTGYFVEVIDHNAYVAYFDAIQPYMDIFNVASSNSISPIQSIPKGGAYGRLSDIEKIGDYIYISDEFIGAHHLNTNNGSLYSFEAHDIMSLSVMNNRLTCLGIWGGLYDFDVSTPAVPSLTNYRIDVISEIDYASYPHTSGSFHSWIRNNGTNHFVANISDKKLKKVSVNSTDLSVVNQLNISGHATAFTLTGNYGFITTRASSSAPLMTSFDGVTMVNLNTMTILDTKVLSNASGVAVKNNTAYVTDDNGLHIYDFSSGSLNLINTYQPGFGNYISINN